MSERASDLYQLIIDGGVARVHEMINNQDVEELFLDYKRANSDGGGTKLHADDRKNLSRAISGFANSEGGIVVWGVDCRPVSGRGDVPTGSMPIQNPTRFKSWLEQATSGLTIPVHSGVLHHAVPPSETQTGYVVSLIPQGQHPPYLSTIEHRYLMRAGSMFLPVSHTILVGMFGRRPHPSLRHTWARTVARVQTGGVLKLALEFTLANDGLGIAEDVYVNVDVMQTPGPYNLRPRITEWEASSVGSHTTVMLKRDKRMPPGASMGPFTIELTIEEKSSTAFSIGISYGATGAPRTVVENKISGSAIRDAYVQFHEARPAAPIYAIAENLANEFIGAASLSP